MQGNYGPKSVMSHAIAEFTPNVYWAESGGAESYFDVNGTSSATPQVAAACALWMSQYGKLNENHIEAWQRVEACRHALFRAAKPSEDYKREFGNGILDVNAMLNDESAESVWNDIKDGHVKPFPRAEVSFPFWRLLFGLDEPGGDRSVERMYETEALQAVMAATNHEVLASIGNEHNDSSDAIDNQEMQRAREWFIEEWRLLKR